MVVAHMTYRWLVAAYMALLMPLCCCYSSALATSSTAPHQHTQTATGHDHGHHAEARLPAHHHDQPQPDQPDGPCDCGCSGPDGPVFAIEKTLQLDWTVQALPLSLARVLAVSCWSPPAIQVTAPLARPPDSLLRLHCALIV